MWVCVYCCLMKHGQMLAEERRKRIVSELGSSDAIRTDALASSFGVSIETIRRDLKALEDQGLTRRVHGGAVRSEGVRIEAPYPDRALTQTAEKSEIAIQTVNLLVPGGTFFFDLGTTVAAVVSALPLDFSGTVITTSVYVATLLARHEQLNVLVTGGRMRRGDLALSGSRTIRFLEGVFPDVAVISTGAVDAVAGITDYDPDESETKQVMLRNARRTIAVADSSKFGKVAPFRVCAIDAPHLIVADSGLRRASQDEVLAAGGRLLVEEPSITASEFGEM